MKLQFFSWLPNRNTDYIANYYICGTEYPYPFISCSQNGLVVAVLCTRSNSAFVVTGAKPHRRGNTMRLTLNPLVASFISTYSGYSLAFFQRWEMISSCSETRRRKPVIAVDLHEVGFPYAWPCLAYPHSSYIGYTTCAKCYIFVLGGFAVRFYFVCILLSVVFAGC